jgi:hypothetical protein
MLRTLAWPSSADLLRAQFSMFHAQGDQIDLTDDDRRCALDLDDRTWMGWTDFMRDGPIPAEPIVSEMLRRLGETAYYLSVIAERTATRS